MVSPSRQTRRLHVNLTAHDIGRIRAVVGTKARSQFIRDAVRRALDQVDPDEQQTDAPYLVYDGGYEPRLTASGRSLLFTAIRMRGFDDAMINLGFTDPVEFIHALFGHRTLPGRGISFLVLKLLPPE